MISDHCYVYPDLGRAGLGNELFPLLRAAELAEQLEVPLLPARWFRPRIGPYLRRENDKRAYWRLFERADARLLSTRTTRAFRPTLSEEEAIRAAVKFGTAPRGIVRVSGMRSYFRDLQRTGAWHRDRLLQMLKNGVVSDVRQCGGPYIAVHIRLGDFQRLTNDRPLAANNQATPLPWYMRQIDNITRRLPRIPVILMSDGSDLELKDLLDHPRVRRAPATNAVSDMLALSYATGIVGSRSTFSAWGAFLGETPMLVAQNGNAYAPHDRVWEAGSDSDFESWLSATRANMHGGPR